MNSALIRSVIQSYPILENQQIQVLALGEGLIHETLLIEGKTNQWVLQGFNEAVFNFPERIDHNLSLLSIHSKSRHLPFLLPLPIFNISGEGLTEIGGKKYRLFDFVKGKTLQQIDNPSQAYIAAQAYGEFAKWAKDINGDKMQETIADFHRLDLRYQKLQHVGSTKFELSTEEKEILDFYLSQLPLVKWYQSQLGQLSIRVTHNDTKINNLIFSADLSKVQALIDLDTVMGGFLMYDIGDLVRTVTCSLPETSIHWEGIHFSPSIFEKLLEGYWKGVSEIATLAETKSLLFGGEIMTMIMGLRFFTDHLQGNIYYKVSYPMQNFDRAKNQMIFLKAQQDKRDDLLRIWSKVTGLNF
jgi:hypothetical protein